FGFSLCFPVLTSTLQAEVPDAVRGRVMAFHQMAHLGNRPFAALLVGAIAVVVGAQSAVLLGLLLVPLGLLASSRAWRALANHHRAAADAVARTGGLDWTAAAGLDPDGAPAGRV
ncbi:MAG: Transrane secretion effector, partial [Chloroflexota bacterium]|nr:Transrane secretion effector [Chloroflexota bacterium]